MKFHYLVVLLLLPIASTEDVAVGGEDSTVVDGGDDLVGTEESDACSGIFDPENPLGSSLMFITEKLWQGDIIESDFYEACVAPMAVDYEKMLEHITSLNAIFKQYHSFYDLARDPQSSESSYQSELGYSIMGEGEGQVDLEGGLTEIYNQVANNSAATVATFWEIQTLFNRLYDFHVALPETTKSFSTHHIRIVPARLRSGSDVVNIIPTFGMDGETGNVTLAVAWELSDGSLSDPVEVTTMNGMSVTDFYADLAYNPALSNPYQSVGARFNNLLKVGGLMSDWMYGPMGRPSDILPSLFEVTYSTANGEEESETWYTGIYNGFLLEAITLSEKSININKTMTEAYLNSPGRMYQVVENAVGRILNLEEYYGAVETVVSLFSKKATKQVPLVAFEFEPDCISTFDTGDVAACYKIEDGYAIFKLSSFMVDYIGVVALWNNMTSAAKEAAVTKVLVDISGNGGGSVLAGYTLIMGMFPSLDTSLLKNAWDVVYNEPMEVFYGANEKNSAKTGVLDVTLSILDELNNFTIEDYETSLADITEAEMRQLQSAAQSISELCTTVDAFDGTIGEMAQCAALDNLVSLITEFASSGDAVGLDEVLRNATLALLEYNPWSVVFGGSTQRTQEMMDFLGAPGPRSVTRGGVETNLTEKFDLINGTLLDLLASDLQAISPDHSFESYVILSDGVAGSMASIFTKTVSQLWKNRDKSNVDTEVITVAYGGTGWAEDITMGSVPASVQGVSLEDPFIASGLMFIITSLLPQKSANYDAFNEVFAAYDYAVAYPPYFAASLPRMPVVGFYSGFMEPDAMPLQYVKMPPDEYLPSFFTKVDFSDSSDLKELYATVAAKFFEPILNGVEEGEAAISKSGSESTNEGSTTNGELEDPMDPDNMNIGAFSGGSRTLSFVAMQVLGSFLLLAMTTHYMCMD